MTVQKWNVDERCLLLLAKLCIYVAMIVVVLTGRESSAQTNAGFRYFYDDAGHLTNVIDSFGNEVDYTYDAVGNIVQILRRQAPGSGAIAIANFTPVSGAPGSIVTIQGQNFSTITGSNAVSFNGVAATVVSATATVLVAIVPSAATTGLISVTVGANAATSATNFTVVAFPILQAITPRSVVSGSQPVNIPALQVTGSNLTASTFSFSPAFYPSTVTVNSATIDPSGTSATLNVTVAAGASGSYIVLATNSAGASSQAATSTNTLRVLSPGNDDDGDGLTNAIEAALGTDPLNAQTSGSGLPDGWQVFYGLNPLDPSSAGPDPAKSGNTALQDFQRGLSPRNPNRVPPAVSQITPKDGATKANINASIVVRFAEPLLTGTSLAAAQSSIAGALSGGASITSAAQTAAAQTLQSYMNRICCGNSVVPGAVTLTGPNGGIAGSVTPSSDGLSAVFGPATPLPANTTFAVRVQGVRDAAGNLMSAPFSSSFTTGTVLESTPPTVVVVDPENNLTGVPTNVHYTIQFSKVMDPSTLTPATFSMLDRTYNAAIAGTVQVDASGMTASFVPNQPLPIQRSFSVSLTTAIKDIDGNYLAAVGPFYFSTGYTAETAPPHLMASSPASNATSVPLNAIVDLLFSQPLNIPSVVPNIQVSSGGQRVPVMVALSSGDQRVTVTPAQALQPGATYTVTVGTGISDLAGLNLDHATSFTFQAGEMADKTPLTVSSVTPANGSSGIALNALIRVGFNKPVDQASVAGGAFVVYPSYVGRELPIAGTMSVSGDQLSLTFTPKVPMQSETEYCIYVYGVDDLTGAAQSGATLTCFTTGATVESSSPVVSLVSPPNGAIAVVRNALVEVQLSTPIDTLSVGANAITVKAGGVAVPGTVTVSGSTVTWKAASLLAANTAYTVTVGGFTDLAGNAVTAFTSGFTTSSSMSGSQGSLQVTAFSPANGSTNVAVTAPVVVTFNAAVNPVTVNSSSVSVRVNGTTVAGTYAVNGAVVTFTPLTPYPGNATVGVLVGYYANVQDLAGNSTGFYYGEGSSFTTAGTVDKTAPVVVSVTPANGAAGIGLNGQVVVTFSKSMNPSTFNTNNVALLANGNKQSFYVSMSGDNRTATLYSLNLPGSAVVTLAITHGVTDLAGNALADYESQFTTAGVPDTSRATVVNQRPANGATGVLVGASIVLYLNEALDAGTVPGAVHVTANGQLVNGVVKVVGNGQTVEFVPSSTLPYGALVQVFLDSTAQDLAGNGVIDYSSQFTAMSDPGTTAPALINVSPMSGSVGAPLNAVIHLQYSAALSASAVNPTNVYLNGNVAGRVVTAALTLDKTGTVIELKPSAALAANTVYCYYATNLQGTNGLGVAGHESCFTTGAAVQGTAPTVKAVSPADGLGNVPVNANIDVLFSGPVDPTTVNGTTIQVTGGNQTVLPYSVSFTNNNQTVMIKPLAALPVAAAMTLTVAGVKDLAGNAVAVHTTHFSTGSVADTVNPVVVVANPTPNAGNVPVNVVLSVQASAPIDPATVNSNTYQLYDHTLSQYVAASYSQSSDGTTVYLLPGNALAANRQYTIYFASYGMADLAGNPLSGGGAVSNYTFTTGYAASTSAPQVTGVSPTGGMTGVAINAHITVQFNEPVNAESVGQVTLKANGSAVAIGSSLSTGNQSLTLVPAAELLQNTAYTLTIAGVTDLAGHVMSAPVTSSFITGTAPDFTQPSVVTVDPANGLANVPSNVVLRLQFNKKVAETVSNFNLYPYEGGAAIGLTQSVSGDGLNVTLSPVATLENETYYCLSVSGVVDLEGQNLTQNGLNLTCFTTGPGVQRLGPVVVLVSPPKGATAVPVNTLVEVSLNEPISLVSVGANAITVKAGGVAVAGTVTASGSTVTWKAASLLAANTAYTVTVGGFTDLAGNPVTAFTSGFTTSSSVSGSQGSLQVTAFSPANGSTNVAVTAPVVVTFNAAVNPVTVNSDSVKVQANGTTVAGTYAVNGAVVTFTPLTPFPGNARVGVLVGYYANVQDLTGNNTGFYYGEGSNFTTAGTVDKTAPVVVSVTPANGVAGVGLNGQVVVTFSKSMNPSTFSTNNIALLANGSKQGFYVSMSGDNRTATLYSLNLPGSAVVTLAITHDVTDLAGNALADYESQFTTAGVPDTSRATVVNQRPANGATGVPVGASIVLYLNEALDAGTVPGAVHVTANGQLVNGVVKVVGNGQTVEFVPSTALPYGALVQVFLDSTAQDLAGNGVIDYSSQFTAMSDPGTTAPALINVSPMNGAAGVPLNTVIDLQYSAGLSTAAVNSTNVYLNGNVAGRVVTAALTLDKTGTVIELKPSAALAANTVYCYYATNLQGTNGLGVTGHESCFTTGAAVQGTAPTVKAVSPADGLGNVPVNANIDVLFSGPVDPTTVNGTTIQVTGGNQTVLPYSISFTNNNQTVMIKPLAALPVAAAMTLTVAGVKDLAGNAVALHTTHFSTGSVADTVNPVVVVANPSPNAGNVPVNVVLSVQASAPIDPATINSNTYQLYDHTLSQYVAASYSQSSDGTTVYLLPGNALAANREYTIYFASYGMADLAGNPLSGGGAVSNYTFTTGYAASTSAPQVTGVSPTSGMTGVAINAHITVQFNEPVNAESLGQVTLKANGSAVAIGSSLSTGNQSLTLVPSAELLQNTAYTLTIAGVTDLAGHVMSAPVTSSFVTGTAPDFTQPSVLSITPGNQTTAVDTHATIHVQFNKHMNPLTISGATFNLLTSGQVVVAGMLVVSQDSMAATFTPNVPLSTSTAYVVRASGGILDLDGLALTSFQSTFTTGNH